MNKIIEIKYTLDTIPANLLVDELNKRHDKEGLTFHFKMNSEGLVAENSPLGISIKKECKNCPTHCKK